MRPDAARPLDITDLDIKSLMVFDAICKTQNLSLAAERLNITQPAVSRYLARMRDSLDDPLFTRHHNRMVPTTRARLLSRYVNLALNNLHAGIDCFEGFDAGKAHITFRIGLNDLIFSLHAPVVVDAVSRSSDSIDLSFFNANYIDALTLLDEDVIDVAIASHHRRSARYCSRILFKDDYVTMARKHHPAIGREGLTLKTYVRLQHVLVTYENARDGWVDHELARLGLNRRVRLRLPFFSSTPLLVADSDMLCTLPRRFARHFETLYPIDLHEVPFRNHQHSFFLIWLRRRDHDPAHIWLRDTISQAVEQSTT